MANRIEIYVEVDPNGKGAAAIKGVNAQLETIGNSGVKASSGVERFGTALDRISAFIAGGALLSLSKSLVDVAVESEQANRRLSASATEAGLSYADLSKNAQQFAKDARVSNTEAANTVSELTRLATLAGQTQNLETIQKRFLDLAAARGIATKDLSIIARQIIAGEDEGINRLGLPNPSIIYEQQAKALGKSTEALTQQEQIQSLLNAVMEKAATFTGANEEAQRGLTGQTQEASKAITDLGTNLGVALTSNVEFQESLKITNEILKSLGTSADDVKTKLKNGVTPEQIADEEAQKTSTRLANLARSAVQQPGAGVGFVSDLFTDGFTVALNRFNESSLENTAKRTKDRILQLAKAAQKEILDQEAQAAEQAKQNSLKDLRASATAGVTNNAKILVDNAGRQTATLEDTRKAIDYLKEYKNVLSAKDYDAFSKKVAESFLKQSEAIRKTRDEFRSFITDTSASFADNKFAKLFIEMDTAAERAQKRFGALGKDVVDFATKLDRLNLAKQINEGIAAGNLSGLKLAQEANRLDKPLIGLSGAEERRLSTLEARLNAVTSTADNRQLADFLRNLNSFSKNGSDVAPSASLAETFSRFTQAKGFDKERLAQIGTGQLDDVLSQVLSLRGLGGQNADEEATIAAAVLSTIKQIPDELLRNSTLSSVRSLREIGAQSADDAARLQQQKAREQIERELAGNQARTDALEQLRLAQSSTGVSKDFRNAQILAITGELGPNELTGQLRAARVDALRSQSALDFNQKNEGLEISRKMFGLLDSINKQLSGAGVSVIDKTPDDGSRPLINVRVDKDGNVTQNAGRMPSMNPAVAGPGMNNNNLTIPLTGGSNGLSNR